MRQKSIAAPALFWPVLSCLVVFVALLGLMLWLDPWMSRDWPLHLLALNLIPTVLFTLFWFGLFRRLWPAAVLTGATLGWLYYVNQVKLEQLGQPLLLTDLLLIPQVLSNLGFFTRYSHSAILVGVVLLLLVMLALAFRLERPRVSWRTSAVVCLLAAALLVSLASPPFTGLYQSRGALDTPWTPITAARATGLVAALTAATGTDLVSLPRPQPQRAERLRNFLHQQLPAGPPSAGTMRPDLVVILSESFFDPGLIRGVDSCAMLPDWCELVDLGIAGGLTVPTFGGNTTRTEYEVLTGVPYRKLPSGVYPYTSIVTRPTASLASWLSHLGYRNVAIHPHARTFWQRDRAMPLLGFDDFIAEENFGPHRRVGYYISDADMTRRVIEELESDPDQSRFVFAISMENHGPWHGVRPYIEPDRLAALPVPPDLGERGAHSWRQYLYHARNSTAELRRLHQFILERDRPTLILFFGDHLPGLHDVFARVQFVNGASAPQQPVPFLLLGNVPIDTPGWLPERSHQLADWLLQAAGVPTPSIYRELALAHQYLAEEGPDSPFVRDHLPALYRELIHTDPRDWQAEPRQIIAVNHD